MPGLVEHVDEMQDHWWWRPGWRVGRHFYACHFVMGGCANLVELVRRYQDELRRFPGLDLIPGDWLHLTMQGVGFVDEVTYEQVTRIERAIRERIALVPVPLVTFHQPVVRPEAIYLPAAPSAPIAAVRHAVRAAIADVLGADNVEQAPEHVQGYRPHVSVAYSNSAQPAEPIAAALAAVTAEPVTLALRHVALLEFHRDARMYQWSRAEQIPIGVEPRG
ncbi:2'-5' RNA ligase family protein [Micromonospora sp. NPDC049204]|uniref:2'-5' RNA ligase family protein n=1 Tax=Micromonospora sp. NPDC049204 TaxID=3154351 RepID=UPI0033D23F0F